MVARAYAVCQACAATLAAMLARIALESVKLAVILFAIAALILASRSDSSLKGP